MKKVFCISCVYRGLKGGGYVNRCMHPQNTTKFTETTYLEEVIYIEQERCEKINRDNDCKLYKEGVSRTKRSNEELAKRLDKWAKEHKQQEQKHKKNLIRERYKDKFYRYLEKTRLSLYAKGEK